jgi:hypothetical protein
MININNNNNSNDNKKESEKDLNLDNMKGGDFMILASFTRSIDDSHIKDNRFHLIGSICLVKGKEYDDLVDIIFNIENNDNIYNSEEREQQFYLFNIISRERIVGLDNEVRVVKKGNVWILYATLPKLIATFFLSKKKDVLFKNIFGDLNLVDKDWNNIAPNCLFIFYNQMWSNVVLEFKLSNIDISGGSTVRRHVCSSVTFDLFKHLMVLYREENNVFYKIKQILYENYKDPILSASIPTNFYSKFETDEFKNSLINLEICEFGKIENIIYKFFSKEKILNPEGFQNFLNILVSNFLSTIDNLLKGIRAEYKNRINGYEVEINKLLLDYNSAISELDRLENLNTISFGSSNKDKKKLKVVLKELRKDGESLLKLKKSNLKNKISILGPKLDDKNLIKDNTEKAFKEFENNYKSYTFEYLYKYYSELIGNKDIDDFKLERFSGKKKINYNPGNGQKRYYNNLYNSFNNFNSLYSLGSRSNILRLGKSNNFYEKKNTYEMQKRIFSVALIKGGAFSLSEVRRVKYM